MADAAPAVALAGFRPCALVPTYDNPRTIAAVVEGIRRYILDVVVVDDGSGPEGRAAVAELGRVGLAVVHHRERNGGKGAAVKTGFALAAELGFTHALQVDADGQHDLGDIPKLVAAAAGSPHALILGAPQFDDTAPRGRLVGRRITKFWTDLETGGSVIDDPMCGFRVYPLAAANAVHVPSNRMDFDIEVAVRLVWHGTTVVNLPTRVRYLPAEQGGVSHFRMFRDNVRISLLHAKLYNMALWRRIHRSRGGAAQMDAAVSLTRERTPAAWLTQRERGSVAAIGLLVFMCRVLGRRGTRMVLPFIAFYYAAFAREARTASRAYLQRLRQRPVRFTEVVVHVLRFCQCALDRMYFMQGRTELFEIERTGQAHLQRVREQGRGAILLGAHLGSFEALRAMSREEQVPVNVLVHFENARKINSVLSAIAPEGMTGIIAIDPADPSFVFAVQERIEAGELVAILGDRVGLGERSVEVPFMGDLARFPVGAFLLASALGCPVYLTFGLYTAPNRYRLFCEPFSDRVELPRRDRDRRLQDLATRFAARLEHYCRLAPDNWFNFFAFWSRR